MGVAASVNNASGEIETCAELSELVKWRRKQFVDVVVVVVVWL